MHREIGRAHIPQRKVIRRHKKGGQKCKTHANSPEDSHSLESAVLNHSQYLFMMQVSKPYFLFQFRLDITAKARCCKTQLQSNSNTIDTGTLKWQCIQLAIPSGETKENISKYLDTKYLVGKVLIWYLIFMKLFHFFQKSERSFLKCWKSYSSLVIQN